MVPYELTLHNFMCYRNGVPPLRLDGLHIACLSGENGVGKSAMLDAITWALWGKARMSDDDLVAQGESEMQVELSFMLNDQLYRVIRRRQRSRISKSGRSTGGKSALDFQVWDQERWRPLSENTLSETQSKIEQVLHMRYDTFINASFLLQGRADEFTRKQPAERKKVLAEILDLHEYDLLEGRARERARHLKEQINGLDGAIALLRQEADKLELYATYVTEAGEKVTRLSSELEQAEEAQRAADEQVRLLESREARRSELRERLAALREDLQAQQQEIENLHQAIQEAETVLQRQEEIQAGVAALAAAQAELARLDELRPRYDDLQEQHRQQREALKDEQRKLQSELERQQHEAQRLRDLAARRPDVQTALDDLEQRLANLAPLADERERLQEQRRQFDERLSRVNTLLLRHSELTSTLAKRQDSLVAVREEQKRTAARLQRQLRDVAKWRVELEAAQAQQQQATELSVQVASLREQDWQTTEQVGKLRAQCDRFKEQADEIKQRKALLTDEAATTCPLCNNDLGTAGVAAIHTHYDQEITSLRQHYRTSRDEANTLETSLSQLREQVQTAENRLAQAQQQAARVETLQQQLAQADELQSDLDAAHKAQADVERQLADEDYEPEARAELRTVAAELAELTGSTPPPSASSGAADWSAVTGELERERKALERQQASLEKQLAARPKIESEAATRRRELQELAEAAAALPAAEAAAAALAETIERGDFAHELRQTGQTIETELTKLGYTPDAHSAARLNAQTLAHWTDEQRRLEHAWSDLENNRRMLQVRADLLESRSAEIDMLHREELQLEQELRALPAAQRQAGECQQAVSECRRSLDVAQRDLYEKQSLHARAQQAADQLAQQQQQRQALAEQQALFQELAEACGKKGVQAMLIETAIPEIEREANRLLSRITGNQMHVTFEMQRSTKKGDTVETLDIKIADALGTRTYDAFSGGEATRINFAIRIALSRLLAGRAGASLETLVIDEGMGALDADGRERFVEAITSVQHDFKRILVITHLDELKDRFPARIEITKAPTGSTWTLL